MGRVGRAPSMAMLTFSKSMNVRDFLLDVVCTRMMVCLLSACWKVTGTRVSKSITVSSHRISRRRRPRGGKRRARAISGVRLERALTMTCKHRNETRKGDERVRRGVAAVDVSRLGHTESGVAVGPWAETGEGCRRSRKRTPTEVEDTVWP